MIERSPRRPPHAVTSHLLIVFARVLRRHKERTRATQCRGGERVQSCLASAGGQLSRPQVAAAAAVPVTGPMYSGCILGEMNFSVKKFDFEIEFLRLKTRTTPQPPVENHVHFRLQRKPRAKINWLTSSGAKTGTTRNTQARAHVETEAFLCLFVSLVK